MQYFVALNRHEIFTTLLSAWNSTGNPAYPRLFANLTADWVCQFFVAPTEIKGSGEAGPWETIQAGIRLGHPWPAVFYGFQRAPEFRVATRLAMAASVAQHGAFLNRFADRGSKIVILSRFVAVRLANPKSITISDPNFRSMQFHGLANVAAFCKIVMLFRFACCPSR